MQIRPATLDDAHAIAHVYNHYVEHTTVSFEEATVSAEEMARRIAEVTQRGLPWLVADDNGRIAGYAYASPWKPRSAYRYSVETSVYLASEQTGRGLGTALYRALFECLRQQGLRTAIGGIALPNAASVALHQKMGMERVAHFRDVCFKHGRWLDVGYWQVTL